MKPIKLTDQDGNSTDVPGAVAFIAVLMEENSVPDYAAEEGHQAFNSFVASTLANFVTTIDLVQFNQSVQGRMVGGLSRDQAIQDELQARLDVVRQDSCVAKLV